MSKNNTKAAETAKKGGTKGLLLYLLLTLLMLMLMGSFVSDNVYTSATKLTTDNQGVSYAYQAAIGDGTYDQLTSTQTYQQ